MKRDRDLKNPWLLVLALLIVSAALNVTMFTKTQARFFETNQVLGRAMSLIVSADNQLHAAIRAIEDDAEIVESLYAIGEVRTRLNEAQGLLWGIKEELSENGLSIYVLPETIRAFDAYLEYDVLAGWRHDGNEALNASRDAILTELRSMKRDLAGLASLSPDSRRGTYDMRKLVGQWENVMKKRIQEEPNAEVHKQVSWMYSMYSE